MTGEIIILAVKLMDFSIELNLNCIGIVLMFLVMTDKLALIFLIKNFILFYFLLFIVV